MGSALTFIFLTIFTIVLIHHPIDAKSSEKLPPDHHNRSSSPLDPHANLFDIKLSLNKGGFGFETSDEANLKDAFTVFINHFKIAKLYLAEAITVVFTSEEHPISIWDEIEPIGKAFKNISSSRVAKKKLGPAVQAEFIKSTDEILSYYAKHRSHLESVFHLVFPLFGLPSLNSSPSKLSHIPIEIKALKIEIVNNIEHILKACNGDIQCSLSTIGQKLKRQGHQLIKELKAGFLDLEVAKALEIMKLKAQAKSWEFIEVLELLNEQSGFDASLKGDDFQITLGGLKLNMTLPGIGAWIH